MELIFIRHGETNLNSMRVYQGHINESLNLRGINQIREVACKVKGFVPNKIYTSPLNRALETTDIIIKECGINITPKVDERISEIDFGLWDGIAYNKVMEGYESEYKEFLRDYKSFTFPGGESFENFYNRCAEFIDEITSTKTDETIFVIAHGGVIRVFLLYLLSMNKDMFYSFSVKQGYYTRCFVYDGINMIDELNV
ncbi:MAG: histidine phosphatase family protein [Clostridium sp.]|uniref:histidine phosphatase family protein n=1 Tax=Clostridium sp. TaxID=1506 RepID=UPI002FC87438